MRGKGAAHDRERGTCGNCAKRLRGKSAAQVEEGVHSNGAERDQGGGGPRKGCAAKGSHRAG